MTTTSATVSVNSSTGQRTLPDESGFPEDTAPVDQDQKAKPVNPAQFSFTDRLVACILMAFSGCCIAVQAGFNATLNIYAGRSFAPFVSFAVALGCCLVFFIFDILVLKTPRPTSRLKEAPWYAWVGGILGAYYVIVNVLTVAKLGAGTVLSIFVCAQVISACVMDHFGLLGVAKRKYTIWRILGSLGLVGCVAVITIF
ncbi:DUF606-domain-containing protein [Hesseltinella vesiculosa]|uniref:DUF606-domain-containing protein n=1 Tax=Hesseltinella vesiculosa TaxID=101127 RepID=A0A1X2GML5_9FUNG|nr:DUF606-domain-containing protein [Hesseltinella vesiculosa]